VPERKTISATEFCANCDRLFDHIAETGDEFIITMRGKPVAMVKPPRGWQPKSDRPTDRSDD
jgi:antitoxin (DNA-binding transcriptional repressor) of toxin-antitoxin stability system